MKKAIILLGGNILNRGVFDNKEKYGADEVIVFDWGEKPAIVGDVFYRCDIKDAERVIKILRQLDIEIIFPYTSADLAVHTVNAINKEFGLKYLCDDVIKATLRKSCMVEKWKEKRLLNRVSVFISQKKELETIDNSVKIIVKPDLCSGSRGITILDEGFTIDKLINAYERAKSASWNDGVVIEEFVTGTEFTVEMLGDAYGNVDVLGVSKKYHTKNIANNKVAIKLHYNPSDVSSDIIERIADFGRECYRALGLNTSLGHLELILSETGILTPVEIGARSSGEIASHCCDTVSNCNFLHEYAEVIRGKKLGNINRMKTNNSAMLFFYDMPNGVALNDATIVEFLPKGVDSISNYREHIHKGERYKMIDGDGERYGFETLVGSRDVLTISNICEAEKEFIRYIYGKRD